MAEVKFQIGDRVRVVTNGEFYHCADATRKLPVLVGTVLVASKEYGEAHPIADLPYSVEFGVPLCECGGTSADFAENELELA